MRDLTVTGVQTCALPIWPRADHHAFDCAALRSASECGVAAEFRRLVVDRDGRRACHLLLKFNRSGDASGDVARRSARLWRVRAGFAATGVGAKFSSQ